MLLTHDPKSEILKNVWKNFPRNPLSDHPVFGNIFQDLAIWVKHKGSVVIVSKNLWKWGELLSKAWDRYCNVHLSSPQNSSSPYSPFWSMTILILFYCNKQHYTAGFRCTYDKSSKADWKNINKSTDAKSKSIIGRSIDQVSVTMR